MITEEDYNIIQDIKEKLNESAVVSDTEMDWKIVNQIEVLDKVVSNLRIAKFSFRPVSKEDLEKRHYTAECAQCSWWGSSKLLEGGGQIADTGDYGDACCPVCGSLEIYEKKDNGL